MNNKYFLGLIGLFLVLLTIDLSAQIQLDVEGEAIITSSSSEPTLTIQNDTKADLLLKRGAATGSLQLNSGGGALGLTGNNGGDNIIQLRTYGTSYFNGGKFGIGTISPDETFHVHKGSAGDVSANGNSIAVFENNTKGYLNILTPNNRESAILFGQPTLGDAAGGILFDSNFDNGLEFRTGGNLAHLIGITADGKMGIGTAAPDQTFHVHKGSAGEVSANGNSIAVFENNTFGYLNILTPDQDESAILFGQPTLGVAAGGILFDSNFADGLEFRTGGNLPHQIGITADGDMGIGTTTPAEKLHVIGNVEATSFIGDRASLGTSPAGNTSLVIENLNENNFGIRVLTNGTVDANGNGFPAVWIRNNSQGGAALFIEAGKAFKPGGGSWSNASDIRTKKDIVNYEEGLAELQKIRTVWYTYNGKGQTPEGQKFVGIIAQDLQKIAPHMIVPGQNGYLAVDPSAFTYMLINAVQELNDKVDKEKVEKEAAITQNEALIAKVNQLESQISTIQNLDALLAKANTLETKLAAFEQLEQKIKTLEADVNFCCQSQGNLDVKAESRTAITLEETAHLEQNTPNPFNGETTIQYYLPKWAYDAQLQITDFNGKILKVENNLTTGHGTISLAAGALPSGTYSYSLLIDGKIVDTKRMVLVK